jgi:hypothetical protein
VERGRFQITPLYYTENYIRLYGYYSTGVFTTTQVCMCVRTTAERAPTSRCKRPGCYSNLFGDGEFEHHSYCCLLCWRVEWDRDICCVREGAALHHHPPRSTPRAAFECYVNGDCGSDGDQGCTPAALPRVSNVISIMCLYLGHESNFSGNRLIETTFYHDCTNALSTRGLLHSTARC